MDMLYSHMQTIKSPTHKARRHFNEGIDDQQHGGFKYPIPTYKRAVKGKMFNHLGFAWLPIGDSAIVPRPCQEVVKLESLPAGTE
jgi:hypothetical protein